MVSEDSQNAQTLPVNAVLCIDADAIDRFGSVLRHLVVGLVDQAIHLRLVSSDPRIEQLSLGPVRTILHEPIVWPVATRRILVLLSRIISEPPTTVHALSGVSYRLASAVNEAFDADLILQVTSQADCELLAEQDESRVGKYITVSSKMAESLPRQGVLTDQTKLIRPGVRAVRDVACFLSDDRIPTVVSAAPFEPGSRVDRLIEAARLLRDRDLNIMLFLMGSGRQEAKLRQQVRTSKLSATVTFANPLGDRAQALASADIFADVAPANAFYVGGLHAMGAGVAVVTGGNEFCDHYRPEETALVCDTSKATALAASIERLVRDRAFARRLAGGGLEYVRNHHSWSGMAERTAQAYRELALRRATFTMAK